MIYQSTLDVVNECLASLSEAPLNSLDDEHPFTAIAQRKLRLANGREQAKGWWFNKETLVLTPDPQTNFIYVPEDTISIDPVSQWTHLVQRGRRLYDPRGAGYAIGRDVQVTLIRLIPFEDLPVIANAYIAFCAIKDFQADYDADRMKVEQNLMNLQEARTTLNAEHTRNVGANLLYRPSTMAKMNALGGRPIGGGTLNHYPSLVGGSTSPSSAVPVDQTFPDFVQIFEDAADGA